MVDRKEIRVSNQDRDKAIERLGDAAAAGQITYEELEERIDLAQQAKFFTQLDDLFVDLGGPLPSEVGAPTSTELILRDQSGKLVRGHGKSPDDPLILDAGWSTETKVGRWSLPPYLAVYGRFGTVRLDCRQAKVEADVINVQVYGGWGTIVFIVPEGWGADASQVRKGWGSVKLTVDSEPSAGLPLLYLHGSAEAGTVKVRHQAWWDKNIS